MVLIMIHERKGVNMNDDAYRAELNDESFVSATLPDLSIFDQRWNEHKR